MGERRRQKRAAARRAQSAPEIRSEPQTTKPAKLSRAEKRKIMLKKAWKKIVSIWTVVFALVGLLGLYVLRPDISIEPYATTDPAHPFEQQFSIQNTSVYSIHNVLTDCVMKDVAVQNGTFHNIHIMDVSEQNKTLEPNAKTTLTCRLTNLRPEPDALIVARVEYATPIGIDFCKAERFKGKSAVGEGYIWTYDGSLKCSASH